MTRSIIPGHREHILRTHCVQMRSIATYSKVAHFTDFEKTTFSLEGAVISQLQIVGTSTARLVKCMQCAVHYTVQCTVNTVYSPLPN